MSRPIAAALVAPRYISDRDRQTRGRRAVEGLNESEPGPRIVSRSFTVRFVHQKCHVPVRYSVMFTATGSGSRLFYLCARAGADPTGTALVPTLPAHAGTG